MQLPTCVRLLISGCLLCHTEETFGVIARAALATFFAAMLTVSFMSPTKVSSACQKVADQVNLLRKRVKADGSVEIVTVEQGQRIEIPSDSSTNSTKVCMHQSAGTRRHWVYPPPPIHFASPHSLSRPLSESLALSAATATLDQGMGFMFLKKRLASTFV
jgi:hypothetical protein